MQEDLQNAHNIHERHGILSEQKEAMNPKEAKIFSLEEVSFHADHNSCWIVIKDGVYDMTDFVGKV